MKTFLKITMGVFVLSLLLACSSKHKEIEAVDFTFTNNSTYQVSVAPQENKGQDWEAFVLDPGESITFQTRAYTICFEYSPHDTVGGYFTQNGCVFQDR